MSWPKVELFGHTLPNPLVISSGTFGYGLGQTGVALGQIGAITLKSLTVKPRAGNPPPRIANPAEVRKEDILGLDPNYHLDDLEDSLGFVNSIGLQNCGIDNFLNDYACGLKFAATHCFEPSGYGEPVRFIASIAGESIEEYVCLTEKLQPCADWLLAIEVNVSCPNVERGLVFGTDRDLTHDLVSALKPISRIPLIVKLTPNVSDIRAIAAAALSAGADGLSLINTIKAKVKMRAGGEITGGVSGPMIRLVARRLTQKVCQTFSNVPVIAGGGVWCKEDVQARLDLGATCVGVGTLNFMGEGAIMRLL